MSCTGSVRGDGLAVVVVVVVGGWYKERWPHRQQRGTAAAGAAPQKNTHTGKTFERRMRALQTGGAPGALFVSAELCCSRWVCFQNWDHGGAGAQKRNATAPAADPPPYPRRPRPPLHHETKTWAGPRRGSEREVGWCISHSFLTSAPLWSPFCIASKMCTPMFFFSVCVVDHGRAPVFSR